ncbi:VOC family protein [Streptomyces sp. NPDC047525]|uniref:VOC family protein n=1 Tax=Streptomyces sp. NPDC047525 TaxID=3155264 RepID=UPI0033E62A62
MGYTITHLHHVGHVVEDMAQAITVYERLGFRLPPPRCPAMPLHEGGAPEPFGTGNTHADFPNSFLELVAWIQDGTTDRLPADAHLVPLEAPADVLPRLVEQIRETSANVAASLNRFEGLHILMLSSPDIDTAATQLSDADVHHGGVNTVRRPTPPGALKPVETVRYLEISGDDPDARSGTVAEGRVGVAADLDPDIQSARHLDHPNGAVDLVEVVLCVADQEMDAVQERYETYLGRAARHDGPGRVIDLDDAALRLVPASGLDALLPGERPAALPAFVGYTVAVHDLSLTRDLLHRNGLPLRGTPSGDAFVPSAAALGAAVTFRQARPRAGQRRPNSLVSG